MLRGEVSVVSGLKNKVMDKIGDLVPDSLRTKQSKKRHEPVEPKKKKPA